MHEFDRLPSELRTWLASAMLPWRPKSVQRKYSEALERTRDEKQALQELDRIQKRLIAKDARQIWGSDHPDALSEAPR